MADPIRHMPDHISPLLQRIHRERKMAQPQELTLPEVCLYVGRDELSSGATLTVLTPTGSRWPSFRTPWAARWAAPVLTVEGALTILRDSAAAAVAELFMSGYLEQ